MESTTKEFKQSLSLLDATMIVVGSMIGSGIFIVSADIVRNVGSAGYLLLVWVLTGVLTLIAAVSYGELSAMYPRAGGQYVYLREAYNPLVGFLYGWSFFAVIQTGTIAAVGVAFAKFTAYIIPELGDKNIIADLGFIRISAAQLVSIVMVVLLTYINSRGIQNGKFIQTLFTLTKIGTLAGLLILGLLLGAKAEIWNGNLQNFWGAAKLSLVGGDAISTIDLIGLAIVPAIAVAMVGSLFSSDSWNNITFIAGEVKNPKRNIGLSLVIGTLVVTILYILMNVMYLTVLPLSQIAFAADDRVGVVAAEQIFGGVGVIIIAITIMISTFGCNNGLILAGARVYYTMAKDGLFFKKAGTLNKYNVPAFGLWIQCIWAAALCLSGRYGDLLDYVIFVVLLFYILTIIGIIVLRYKQPNLERPYKAWGYPILPLIYVIAASTISVLLFIYKPQFTYPGLAIVLIGIPLYFIAIRRKQ